MTVEPQKEELAELYFHTPGSGSRKTVSYRRFDGVARAVSFVMNDVTARDRNTCFLEYGDQRFGYVDIAKLHEDLSGVHETGEST
jgi:hypothetical protein